MKIQAKELKSGMTIRNGYWTVKIKTIKEGNLKNGKKTLTVEGEGILKYTSSNKTRPYPSVEFTFKETTKISLID